MYLNVRSIANKFYSLRQLINSFNMQFQIIALTETWLNDNNEDLFKLKNYDFVSINRFNKTGGGVGIYIADHLKYKTRTDLTSIVENTIESLFIEIITAVGKNIIVGVIYRPPSNKIDSFENEMNEILTKIDKKTKYAILWGTSILIY